MVWLWNRGDYKGIIHRYHWHSIGQLMLAFTIFWGYIAFSQYFLIWNANVPEETFWFNEREFGGWFWIGMILVFGHFLLPFICLLSFRFKVTHHIIRRIAIWMLVHDLPRSVLEYSSGGQGRPGPQRQSDSVLLGGSALRRHCR